MILRSAFVLLGILGQHADAKPRYDQRSDIESATSRALASRQVDRDNSTRPCGYLFDEVKASLDADLYPIFWAGDVYRCLVTVPFLNDVGLRFIEYYNTTLQFQSTLAYLQNPTPEYQQPAIDVVSELGRVKQKILDNQYQRQLDFEYDIHSIVLAMHDSHVTLSFGITAPFVFASPFDIVSASVDGKALPQPFLKEQIVRARNSDWVLQLSPIVTINGFPAVEYLTRFAKQNSFGNLEDHADWNDLFEHPANDIQGFYGTWGGQTLFYPGASLEDDGIIVKLANGTSYNFRWLALLNELVNPGPLETAGDFYNYFVLGLEPASMQDSDDDDDDSDDFGFDFDNLKQINLTDQENIWVYESDGAYPKANISQKDLAVTGGGVVTGYFQEDIGILSLPSFYQFPDEAKEFSATVQKFITEAEKRKLKKIIIDIQQNRGGTVALAFDTFRRFFPEEPDNLPWSWAGSRRRSHPLGDLLGTEITNFWNELDQDDDDKWDEAANEFVISPRIDARNNQTFGNWAKYSPSTSSHYRGDHWSNVERYPLFDDQFLYSAFSSEAVEDDPYGHGHNKINTSQIWKADEIVLLTDGLCSSACSVFANMMAQAGVRSIVAGGRPETGPMQGVAGSRGARAYSAGILDWLMRFVKQELNPNSTLIPNIPPDFETRDSGIWVHHAAFNLRDEILKPDFDANPDGQHLPRQFQYEAAHCRIFYTIKNIYNMTQLWSDVAKAAWTNPGICVADSIGYADLPNQPASSIPPSRLPIHTSGIISTKSSVNNTDETVPIFNEGDIVAGTAPKIEKLVECKANRTCEIKGWRCEDIPVADTCKTGERPKFSSVAYCLPPCRMSSTADSGTSCGKYSADKRGTSSLSCKARTMVETKEKARPQYIGCCQPRNIKASGSMCVKSP
ncbi:hypothetical protein QBC38DRAFT_459657 [Podospora fimiseda]|uniref:Tail specific protease domain-containing protein n=1 Tax=Podospora fimiseda TaxID=252190 RepID=A0AAN7BH06_9PEZI|nr:hypothetical protein QBC38DRAFT_459657 [Podospora fimiseda]